MLNESEENCFLRISLTFSSNDRETQSSLISKREKQYALIKPLQRRKKSSKDMVEDMSLLKVLVTVNYGRYSKIKKKD